MEKETTEYKIGVRSIFNVSKEHKTKDMLREVHEEPDFVVRVGQEDELEVDRIRVLQFTEEL